MLATFGVWLAALLTLCIFSFLYKDNPFYKFAEHLYVGVSAAYWMVYYFNNAIIPNLYEPLFRNHQWVFLLPGFLGLLVFTRLIPKVSWLSRLSFAFYIGVGVGVAVPTLLQANIVPQVQATLLPLNGSSVAASLANILAVVGVVSTLVYFFFSKEHTGVTGGIAKIGIYFIMISFGAAFGYTIMARISLLIGRFNFLFFTWLGPTFGWR
jgi:hypothetical protein